MSKDKAQTAAPATKLDPKRARTAANEIRRAAKVQKELGKKAARKAAKEAAGTLVAKGTARAKRRGNSKHYMVDMKTKVATLTTYGAKPAEGAVARVVFAPSQKAALLACGIKPKEPSDKTVAKKIVQKLGEGKTTPIESAEQVGEVLNKNVPKVSKSVQKRVAAQTANAVDVTENLVVKAAKAGYKVAA